MALRAFITNLLKKLQIILAFLVIVLGKVCFGRFRLDYWIVDSSRRGSSHGLQVRAIKCTF
jgi:hypothetical protein